MLGEETNYVEVGDNLFFISYLFINSKLLII